MDQTDREQQVSALIERLENVRERKGMNMSPVDGQAAQNFVFGFSVAAGVLRLQRKNEIWLKAGEKRGWKIQGVGPIPEMRERGLSDEEIADEVLAIEIEPWRLWLSENEKPTAE
jgi:hypothetical protein